MEIIRKRGEMRKIANDLHLRSQTIGFVPTMGYLHQGHLSLVERARGENDKVVVSIFVNPKQFGPSEDFQKYPRDFERDKGLLENRCDYLFCPDEAEMYDPDEKITFVIKDLAAGLCGLKRPHHFSGVLLVLTKLFHLVSPKRLYLGQKDYQQTVMVGQLLKDLFFDMDLVVCPTVREADGLAMSSRNAYLSEAERVCAPFIFKALQLGQALLERGERSSSVILEKMRDFLYQHGFQNIDYLDIRDASNLQPVQQIGKKVVIVLAVFLGETRLIDNIFFDPDALTK
jgi:pantoate--beta-alanine ligase